MEKSTIYKHSGLHPKDFYNVFKTMFFAHVSFFFLIKKFVLPYNLTMFHQLSEGTCLWEHLPNDCGFEGFAIFFSHLSICFIRILIILSPITRQGQLHNVAVYSSLLQWNNLVFFFWLWLSLEKKKKPFIYGSEPVISMWANFVVFGWSVWVRLLCLSYS